LNDLVSAYRWLLGQAIEPRRIAIGGDSAGGGLAISALVALRDARTPLPAAAAIISPWLDLTLTGTSLASHAALDPLVYAADLRSAAECYAGDHDPHNPLISPIYADLAGLPPTLIHVGEHEVLLSDAQRLADAATAAGVAVQLDIWPEMWHVWHAWAATLPEGQAALAQIGQFVRQHLARASFGGQIYH
jgi:acetyl esterase/lipase